jgi:hypothetical protein
MVYKLKMNKKKGGNPPDIKRRRITFDSDTTDNVKLEFLNIETLTEAYVNAIKEWKQAEEENNREKLMRLSRGTLFTLLVLLGILSYSEPAIIKGLVGEQLKDAINKEMRRLVSEGMDYEPMTKAISEFTMNVSQIRFTFRNGSPLTASQILDIFKQNNTLSPIIETLERTLNIITGSFNEIKGLASSAFKLAENISSGQLTRQNIGDIAGYGIWSIIIYIGMIFTSTTYSTVTGITSMINKMSNKIVPKESEFPGFIPTDISEQSLSNPLVLTINGKQRIITLGDVLYTINNRPQGKVNYINGLFDSVLSFIFSHEEQWTIDETSSEMDKSIKGEAASIVSNALTNDTQSSLSKMANDGYGDEFGRIAEFIHDNFGGKINDSIVLLGENVSLIYGSLFKVVCGRTGLESNESSQQSDYSEISEMSKLTEDENICKYTNDNQIQMNIEMSLGNTLKNDIGQLSENEEIQEAAEGLLKLHVGDDNKMYGGKKYKIKKNKTKKYKRQLSNKKKMSRKMRKTHKKK